MLPTRLHRCCLLAILIVAAACSDEAGEGRLALTIEAETTITDGLDPGSDLENLVDGWTVRFDTYVVAIGDVSFASTGLASSQTITGTRLYDLASLPTGSATLVDSDLEAGRYDRVGFSMLVPTAATEIDASVDPADRDAMVAGGCTYLVRGTLTKADGQSCPGGVCHAAAAIDFELCVPSTVRFSDCRAEGTVASGFAIRAGGTTQAAFTLHGDHMFFDSFPGGAEVVSRRAQWLADADVDADGSVDADELRSIDTPGELAVLFPSSQYSLANAPGGAIVTAFDFVVAQLRTQGHFQGEGECAFEPL